MKEPILFYTNVETDTALWAQIDFWNWNEKKVLNWVLSLQLTTAKMTQQWKTKVEQPKHNSTEEKQGKMT